MTLTHAAPGTGLPSIAGYPMPSTFPANRAHWSLSAERAVLLIHDMQNHFLDVYDRGAQPIPQLLGAIDRLRSAAHAIGVPVVYTRQPGDQHPDERALLTDFWGPGLRVGEPEEITAELAPTEQDWVLTKWRYSAFRRTSLRELMLEHGRDQLVITGIYGHIGCQTTAVEAFMDDIAPFLVGDAIADFSPADHAAALDWTARRCGVVVGTEAVAQAFTPHSPLDLRAAVAHLLGEPASEIRLQDDLIELGLDSIRLMMLTERLVAEGHAVTFAQLAELPTLQAWLTLIGQ